MPVKSRLTKSLEAIEYALTTSIDKLLIQIQYKQGSGFAMPAIVVDQNEVKGYTIPDDKILYVSREIITSRAIMNITIFFATGQNLKLAFPLEIGQEVYADIQAQMGATT